MRACVTRKHRSISGDTEMHVDDDDVAPARIGNELDVRNFVNIANIRLAIVERVSNLGDVRTRGR